jgi:uncharacterized membrane protein YagU involved in acid resistance
MRSNLVAGVAGGLIAGVVFGLMMQMMTAPTPDDGRMPMMEMVAKVVRSDSLVVGWLYHLVNSAMIGGVFGYLAGRLSRYGQGLAWGAAYGVVWWVLGGLVLMPALLGMPPFAPLMTEAMRPVAIGSLIGHIVYGVILGGAYVKLVGERRETAGERRTRAA